MRRLLPRLFLASALLLSAAPPPARSQGFRLRLVQYNVENLFDTLHAAGRDDAEFTPGGGKRWDSRRYWAKQGRLARVIAALGEESPAALVALCEVENDSVLSHLTRRTRLARLGYEYLVTRSADRRGVNVALLYQPALFRPVERHALRVPPPAGSPPTRDVLRVSGMLQTGDTLDLFVCHLPSKRGGRRAGDYRARVARAVRREADSLLRTRGNPLLVITGDFNASCPSPVFTRDLGAAAPARGLPATRDSLYVLSARRRAGGEISGTYKFRGQWEQLDHFIVSGTLLRGGEGQPRTAEGLCRIADFPFLLRRNKGGALYPFRTYLGPVYQGGYSDHLPLVLDLLL